MLGVASVLLRASTSPGLPASDLVSLWSFDETGTTMFDDLGPAGLPMTLVGTWADLTTGSLVQGIDGTSAYTNGSAYATLPANQPAHALSALTISVYFQRHFGVDKQILLAAGDGSEAGDFSIELLATGRLRGWHTGQDARLRFFEDSAGIVGTNLQVGTAHRIDLALGPQGARIYLDGAELTAAGIPANTNGWNNARVKYLGVYTDGTSGPGHGAFDHLRLWNRQLPGDEIALLEAAQDVMLPTTGAGLLGSWPLSETSGITFADATGTNDATLAIPSWIDQSTHELDRPGIVTTNDHALEVSNGGPVIPMIHAYRQAEMSLVMYVDPHGELRGCQYWDESAEAWGREYLAFCDDGSTPGSFAIYRRRNGAGGLSGIAGTKQWRLGGYVRDSGGTAQYFGGSLTGVSGALLPVDTAKRVALTMSESTGATLYLDGAQVATLPSATQGWTLLTQAISIASSPDEGYVHARSPFWGRIDQIEVWQGVLGLTGVQALAPATTTRKWRPPSDFVGGTTDINVAAHGYNLQAAIDAAHASGGKYVYQSEGDMTLCLTSAASNDVGMRNLCKGLVGVRMQRPAGNPTNAPRMIRIGTSTVGGKITSGFGDPYAGSGGYKVWGCYFDGNARSQSWAAISVPGNNYHGFSPLSVQFGHCIQTGANARITVTVAYCEFYDNIGDGVSLSERTTCYAYSNRFYGTFRGPYIYNDLVDIYLEASRCEMHNDGRLPGSRVDNGCGLCDFEPFQPNASTRNRHIMRDCWAESDWDDKNYQLAGNLSRSHYYSCHLLAGALALQPYRSGASTPAREPVDSVILQRCTIAYWHTGGPDGGNFPIEQLRGFAPGTSGLGAVFDHVVFLASGAPQCYHNSGLLDPADDTNKLARMIYTSSGATGRLMTWRNIQVRSRRLPSGMSQANKQALVVSGTLGTSREIEIDGMEIAAEFTSLPFNWGGMRVRYRNCVHEGTGNSKPWFNAGAEVAL